MKKRRWWHRQIIGPPQKWDIRTATSRENQRVAPNVDIRFNSDPLEDCVAYDCMRGWAEVYCRDGRGLVISPDRTHILTKIVSGEVSVTWKPEAAK